MRHNTDAPVVAGFRLLSPLAVMALLAGANLSVHAQNRESITLPEVGSILGTESRQQSLAPAGPAIPMDGPIDASEYYVGPNDVLELNVWSSAPVSRRLTVTPEGTLIIPNVGVVNVIGLSLADAKKAVEAAASDKYPHARITLSLLSPRKVTVDIAGQVLNEGKIEMYSVQRVSNLIQEASTLSPTQMTKEYYERTIPLLRSQASERHIVVHHRDGTVQPVDLVKYQLTGRSIYNPYLREGDAVWVPERTDLSNSIGIFGGVVKPGSFEYVPGDSLLDLLAMSYGYALRSDSTNVLLTRLSLDGVRMDTMEVNVDAIRDGVSQDVPLRPGDRVIVRATPDERQNYFVEIQGEVRRPGKYPITRGSTRLSQIIAMAGGFTSDANLAGATITRSRVGLLPPQDLLLKEVLLSERASVPSQDSSYYRIETELRILGETVAADFQKLFADGDSSQDVVLHSFDVIRVPKKNHTVYVFGQVISPGHVPYRQGQGSDYYVDEAGGFTKDARSGDVKVIKGGTRIWLDPGETAIEDGDMIWVPREPHYPFTYYLTTYAQVAGIVATVATLILLVKTVK